MRKTIYVKSEEEWAAAKSSAKDAGISVSQLLMNGFRTTVYSTQFDRLEGKLDMLIETSRSRERTENPMRTVPPVDVDKTISEVPCGVTLPDLTADEIKVMNDRLLEKRKKVRPPSTLEETITTSKGDVKVNEAMSNFNPQPKWSKK